MNGVGGHVNIGAFGARIVFNDRKFGEHRHGKEKKNQKVFNDSTFARAWWFNLPRPGWGKPGIEVGDWIWYEGVMMNDGDIWKLKGSYGIKWSMRRSVSQLRDDIR
jgi:hypothetical protein